MAGIFSDLLGTTKAFFKIGGTAGVRLKNTAGNLTVRNTGDTADAEITASKVNVSGNGIDLNSDAEGTGSDYKLTLQRAATGMTADVTLTFPINDGTTGQVLQTDGNGNLSFVSAGSNAMADKLDSTAIAFGSTSPIAMFSTGVDDIVDYIEVVVDTAFNGTPSLSIGITGTTSKYAGTTDIDLTQVATTAFQIHPNLPAQGVENLIATYAQGGASAGAARVIVHYATPT